MKKGELAERQAAAATTTADEESQQETSDGVPLVPDAAMRLFQTQHCLLELQMQILTVPLRKFLRSFKRWELIWMWANVEFNGNKV